MTRSRSLAPLLALCLVSARIGDPAAPVLVLQTPLIVFSATAGGPNPPPQPDSITNGGTGALGWRVVNPTAIAGWLTVAPHAGSAPAVLTFTASAAGLAPGLYSDTVEVASNAAGNATDSVVVVLAVRPRPGPGGPAGAWARYEIELTYTGYTGLVQGFPNCQVDTLGYDRLVGTVTGFEDPTPDEETGYSGTLRRSTAIDFCETKGRKGPGDDERAWCAVTLRGHVATEISLTVYGEDGRGAWLKASPVGDPVGKSVRGDCDPPETQAIDAAYPTASDGGAGSPNGQPIDDPNSTLFVNGLARLTPGTWSPAGPEGGWTLRVIRKLP